MKQSIGFIGAGMMGSGICKSLLKAGHPVTVIAHRNRAPIDELVKLGAREAKSAPELAKGVDIVMLCVDRAETVERIISEITPVLRSGQFIIDVTTGKPETSKRIAAALATKGVTYVDAPVTGGPAQAAEGKLAILAGGSPEVFEKLKPIFDTYTVQAILFGPTGAGITAKLLNNFVTQSACQVIMQAYRAARRNDVNWDKLYNAMLQGAARSGIARAHHRQCDQGQLQRTAVLHLQRRQGRRVCRRLDRRRSGRRAHPCGGSGGAEAADRCRSRRPLRQRDARPARLSARRGRRPFTVNQGR